MSLMPRHNPDKRCFAPCPPGAYCECLGHEIPEGSLKTESSGTPPGSAIDRMVDRFLAWKLPASVRPDDCALDQTYPHRIGTHLLNDPETRQMLEQVVVPELAAMQAQIDRLMLEYCPDEMTPEQLAEWSEHQRRVGPEEEAALSTPLSEKATTKDYEDVLEDHRRLCRELDAILSYPDEPARQASLCDLVAFAKSIAARARRYYWLNGQDNFMIQIDGKPVRLKCGDVLDKWIDARIAEATNEQR